MKFYVSWQCVCGKEFKSRGIFDMHVSGCPAIYEEESEEFCPVCNGSGIIPHGGFAGFTCRCTVPPYTASRLGLIFS